MKEGKSLTELAAELERQAEAKHDYLADTTHLAVRPNLNLNIDGQGDFEIRPHAHRQIADRLKIPAKYYERMQTEAPELLAENVNHWFHSNPDRRLVRTLDGGVRAFLSNSFRPIDNYDLMAGAVLPAIQNIGGNVRVASSEVTERRLYVKIIMVNREYRVAVNDVVQAGFIVQNSEIGVGRVSVFPFSLRLVCINGMMHTDYGHQKTHVGGRNVPSGEVPEEWLRDATREADDKALMMKLQDVIRGTADEGRFREMVVGKIEAATTRTIEADPVKVVETTSKRLGLTQDEQAGVLRQLIAESNLTQWGLANAITRHSADLESYDRATELEHAGGEVVELDARQWESILNESEQQKAAA